MSARSGALRAHATQVDPSEPWWFGLDDDELSAIYPWEDWVLARSAVRAPSDVEVETCLFSGIDEVLGIPAGVELPSRLRDPSLAESS
jgi:mycothiol S-conjugate amidase